MTDYADTSFLVALYVPDVNSAKAAARMKQLELPVLITPLGELELLNALQLRLFRKELQPAQARAARAAFRSDAARFIFAVHAISDDMWLRAIQLTKNWTARLGCRSLDIIHVASALVLHADRFNTFDDRQGKLATAAGLVVA